MVNKNVTSRVDNKRGGRKMIKKVLAAVTMAALMASAAMAVTLNGAGASFPYPIYSKWMSMYEKEKGVKVNYAPIGSGGGIRQFTAGVTDFGGTDAFMGNSEIAKIKGNVLHVPTVMGAVAVAYNCDIDKLKLDGDTLAAIFLGDIKKWNDPRIAALNPGTALPDANILVAHRSDSSGTSSIFTNYLAKVSSAWASRVGAGTSVSWPAGVGAKGNPGVAGAIKNNRNSIGYLELAYAKSNGLSTVLMKNRSGSYVAPSNDGVTNAAAGALRRMPSDYRAEILNQPGRSAYPIAGFTWILVKKTGNGDKAALLKDFLNWCLTDGQKYADELGYASLPVSLTGKIIADVNSIE